MREIESREATAAQQAPDPHGATSPAEFVAAMRSLKEWSGLTYRQLQRQAAAVDHILPHSTIAAVLGRNTLPREELLNGFVRACGQDEATAVAWIAVRKRIAAGIPAPNEPAVTPNEPAVVETLANPRTDAPPAVDAAESPDPVVPSPADGADPAFAAAEPAVMLAESPHLSFASGTLASTAATRLKDEWVGTHRYDPAVEVPRPAGLRWLVPPIMYRTGWATRVLSAGLVVLLVFVAVAVTVKIIREMRGGDTAVNPTALADLPGDEGTQEVTPSPQPNATTPIPARAGGPTAPPSNPAASKPPTPKPTTAAAGGDPSTFAGVYRIRPAHTGLCVGEGRQMYTSSTRIVLGQQTCGSAAPPTILERVSGSTYLIKLDHPTNGIGCATVDYGGVGDGLLLAGADCGANRNDQQFTIEPVTAPAAGYRLRAVAGSSYCIGVYNGSTDRGAQLIQTRCDGGKHQVFTFERG